jgi:hypothetical protein
MRMDPQVDVIPIVQAGALERLVVQAEPKRFHHMQGRLGGGAETSDVPSVGRNFRFDEDYGQSHLPTSGGSSPSRS